jgi:hypothetical protein
MKKKDGSQFTIHPLQADPPRRATHYSLLIVVVLTVALLLVSFSAYGQEPKLIVKGTDGITTKFVVTDGGEVGINTDTPTSQLETANDGGANSDVRMTVSSSGSGVPVYYGRRSGGSLASPTATPTGKGLFWLGALGHGTTGWSSLLTGLIGFWSTENWTDTAMGTEMRFYTTPNGSSARAERMRVNANGNVTINNLAGSYTNGSAYVCVNNSGQLYTSESGCP